MFSYSSGRPDTLFRRRAQPFIPENGGAASTATAVIDAAGELAAWWSARVPWEEREDWDEPEVYVRQTLRPVASEWSDPWEDWPEDWHPTKSIRAFVAEVKEQRRRFVAEAWAHRRADGEPEDLFLQRVIRDENGCWIWHGPMCGQNRYGQFLSESAHRVSFRWWVGPIPDGHDVDHKCSVTRCVNPEHLEAVTPEENQRRAVASRRARKATAA